MKKHNTILSATFCVCSIIAEIYLFKRYINEIKKERTENFVENDDKYIKFKKYYTLMNKWFIDKCNNVDIGTFLKNNGYKNIAVYGIGELGKNLLMDLKDKDVVKYLDVLVDGQFVDELRNPSLKWAGSDNQRVINVQETLRRGEVVLYTGEEKSVYNDEKVAYAH